MSAAFAGGGGPPAGPRGRKENNGQSPYGGWQPGSNSQGELGPNRSFYIDDADRENSNLQPNPHPSALTANSNPNDKTQSNLSLEEKAKRDGSRQRTSTELGRRPSGPRFCEKCGEQLQGQFVRALGALWHLECFSCRDCGKTVAQKFFPREEEDGSGKQFALCETDYFRRLDLLCAKCGGALRGSYITAVDKKYHIDHFTCSSCSLVFGEADSYYEHESNVYCHYHYSTRYAAKCNGCQNSILKQFIELFRNGVNQHWHPECYMIHKFWNVRLWPSGQDAPDRSTIEGDVDPRERDRVMKAEDGVENKVHFIWISLSMYEEKSATRISDMLLQVSNGLYYDSIKSARYFITHCEVLFNGCTEVERLCSSAQPQKIELHYEREAKVLCKKLVGFFTLMAESARNDAVQGVSQDLLTLVTGLAHYLKLVIRIALQGSLKHQHTNGSDEALHKLLGSVNGLEETIKVSGEPPQQELDMLVTVDADRCRECGENTEGRTVLSDIKRAPMMVFHPQCIKCWSCQRPFPDPSLEAYWSRSTNRVVCKDCVRAKEPAFDDAALVFHVASRLQNFAHLLKVAHARLLASMKQMMRITQTTVDDSLLQMGTTGGMGEPPMLSPDSRSRSYAAPSVRDGEKVAAYQESMGKISRMRSTRLDKRLSSTMQRARSSRIINSPEGLTARPGSSDDQPTQDRGLMQIIDQEEPYTSPSLGVAGHSFGTGPVLDDLPRLFAREQARQLHPNAARYAGDNLIPEDNMFRGVKYLNGHARQTSGDQNGNGIPTGYQQQKKYFSQLSPVDGFIVKHVSVTVLSSSPGGDFTQDELLSLIETRSNSVWKRLFAKNDRSKQKTRNRATVFGNDLAFVIEHKGAETTDCVGPGSLRVPAVLADAITAMHNMDMTAEGIFRKSGNIGKLRDLASKIDADGSDSSELIKEGPIQVAVLIKRFLRDLPEPLLTFKLHKLWIHTAKITHQETRLRVLHLTVCLLPKPNRDTLEVLCSFLAWVASFSLVDEETGSKMDMHNLATVIAPNILYEKAADDKRTLPDPSISFLAIETVFNLIQHVEEFAEVPADIQHIMSDPTLFGDAPTEITTKEILKRVTEYANRPKGEQPSQAVHTRQNDSRSAAPVVHNQDSSAWGHTEATVAGPSGTRPYRSQAEVVGSAQPIRYPVGNGHAV
ncbi:RhoGAP-domain-containing protein [Eremomyces bilateralis CBS 781.70]|uniref:RhoGAP-domain-containing protein n=1 Tax=Eremomyces bilateralis CBS 781.70 TaxID=1392243 RepID=A0A6G1FZR8_9PEZI|nr:RhoGAP-domain-containing protein [Eremomyces bilateralis CBS 781.70]KAF1811355.1 RhoGAP-domain-containing protein [Eremomyces bilateralis CBS 781.70]